MSETVACGLQMLNEENTRETRIFIRMMDKFFDCLNVKGPMMGILKRKENLNPYSSHRDERFEV